MPWVELAVAYLALPALCILCERFWPATRGQRILRPGFGADLCWLFTQSLMYRYVAPAFVLLLMSPVILLAGMTVDEFLAGFGPLSRLPLWQQAVLAVVVGDFFAYWQHRLAHGDAWWSVHAIHHSSTQLDWLSGTRFHPANEILSQLIYLPPVLVLGLAPAVYPITAAIAGTATYLLHSNVRFTFGPLRYVLASPTFHRYHHTHPEEGGNRNFGALLTVWDLLFGTFAWPDRAPQRFGTRTYVPEGFRKQLLFFKYDTPGADLAPGVTAPQPERGPQRRSADGVGPH